jgi:hypothetical protein
MDTQSNSNQDEVDVVDDFYVKLESSEGVQVSDELLEKNTVVRFYFTVSSKGKELLRRDGYEFRFESNSKLEEGIKI